MTRQHWAKGKTEPGREKELGFKSQILGKESVERNTMAQTYPTSPPPAPISTLLPRSSQSAYWSFRRPRDPNNHLLKVEGNRCGREFLQAYKHVFASQLILPHQQKSREMHACRPCLAATSFLEILMEQQWWTQCVGESETECTGKFLRDRWAEIFRH